MGLFNLNKKEEKGTESLPELPDFPDLPSEGLSEFPSYESALEEPKKEAFELPTRKKVVDYKGFNVSAEPSGKPIFVKIEKYKEAIRTINNLKGKIAEAEKILDDIEAIKVQEEKKLQEWKNDLEQLKNRLVSIDNNLFEV